MYTRLQIREHNIPGLELHKYFVDPGGARGHSGQEIIIGAEATQVYVLIVDVQIPLQFRSVRVAENFVGGQKDVPDGQVGDWRDPAVGGRQVPADFVGAEQPERTGICGAFGQDHASHFISHADHRGMSRGDPYIRLEHGEQHRQDEFGKIGKIEFNHRGLHQTEQSLGSPGLDD